MDYSLKIFNKRNEITILLVLVLTAFILRLLVLIFFIDIPGDGPMHAIDAYSWSRSPYSNDGVWLPGFMYLAGVFSLFVRNPLISSRLLNMIIGALTIPIFYFLIVRIFSKRVALFSTAILVFLPLHIDLSASSLTDVSFVFEIFSALFFMLKALEEKKREWLFLSLSLLSLSMAVMTRYEAWPLIPFLPSYYFYKTRKVSNSILMMLILLIPPACWMLSNYGNTGSFLPVLSAATTSAAEAVGAHPLGLLGSLRMIVGKAISHLGWVLIIGITTGIMAQTLKIIKREITPERLLYISIMCLSGAFIVYLGMSRGRALWDRYLLFSFIMALPFAVLPLVENAELRALFSPLILYLKNYSVRVTLVIVAAILLMAVSYSCRNPMSFVTRKRPVDIERLAEWIQKGNYRNDAVLLTKLDWQSSYLPLYLPKIGSKTFIVSIWAQDSKLNNFIERYKPSLLVTRDKDEEFKRRIEAILGSQINEDRLVHRQGSMKIYDIKSLIQRQKAKPGYSYFSEGKRQE